MIIGIDLDNTIVRYDAVIYSTAVGRGLVPADTPATKRAVRDALRRAGREDDWTELQGHVYGPGMAEAVPFPGVEETLRRWRDDGLTVLVISHRTPRPFRGPPHDLHAAAREWLERRGFFDPGGAGLTRERVFLEAAKEAKLARIATAGCRVFIDDLPEFLSDPAFPPGLLRILFDPNGEHAAPPGVRRAASWAEIGELIWMRGVGVEAGQDAGRRFVDAGVRPDSTAQPPASGPASTPMTQLPDAAASLLAEAGLRGPATFHPLPGGANNRVYRVEAGGARALLKAYFRHPDDPRDRLDAEFRFARFAWDRGLRCLPRPLARDSARGLGLYEFIEGAPLRPGDVTAARVEEALEFHRGLNAHREAPEAAALPPGSEACFSLAHHRECVERRVGRLGRIEETDALHRDVVRWIRADLAPAWETVRRALLEEGAGRTDRAGAGLPAGDRCLSPSDFGFHNALLAGDGRLRFIDFEYAGWDDPAKLVCDFFCQPRVPVPFEHWPRVLEAVAGPLADPEGFRRRAAALLPAYRIKWCCILLNDFLPADAARRRFAGAGADETQRLAEQFDKAWQALAVLSNTERI
jgi:hypothetical protein